MVTWKGSAAVCLNEKGEFLMVKQGQPHEIKKWTIPSGEQQSGESSVECCKREVEEETGYRVEVIKEAESEKGHGRGVQCSG